MHPVVSHTCRENNMWADQLNHRDTSGFNPELKIKIKELAIKSTTRILVKLIVVFDHLVAEPCCQGRLYGRGLAAPISSVFVPDKDKLRNCQKTSSTKTKPPKTR